MHVEGSFAVRRDRASVFAFFSDPRKLIGCLDDPHTVEVVDSTHFTGTITTGVAFLRGTFRYSGEYTDVVSPERTSARVRGTGLGSGVDATIGTALDEADGSTTVRWTADLTFSGPIVAAGERVIRGTVDKKTQGLFGRAKERLESPQT